MPDKKGSDDRAYARGFAAGRAAATPPDTDLLAELVKLVEIHHNTVRPSKLHDPVSIHDWRDCPCLTCRRVASVEAVVKAEGRTPVVGRYMRWLRNEWGATPSTCRDYEAILARMALMLGDREAIDVGIALECVFRDALSAAWRVVTGSNAAVSGGDEGNTP